VKALVTGGSGYFGSLLAAELRARGHAVRVLDLVDADDRPAEVELVLGDIRDPAAVRTAVDGVDVVFHNVAQVPLVKDRVAFVEVNVLGTQVLLDACADARVAKVVHTSSSAVFGVPRSNPVHEGTGPSPAEPYGWAKYEAELLCQRAADAGLDVTIVRPRTILGHGRLGIFSVVFDFVADGADVFVLGTGDNRYQFVHARDLADACIRAGERPGPRTYNIGAAEFGTMRESLEGLIAHAGTGSRVRGVPALPTTLAMRVASGLQLAPFAPYHWIMYGKSMWFDIEPARRELGWEPRSSAAEMFAESYDWFLAHRTGTAGASEHRRPVRQGVLALLKRGAGAGAAR
jgi:nucleoside-diphosphate-sugar epimerase